MVLFLFQSYSEYNRGDRNVKKSELLKCDMEIGVRAPSWLL